MVAKMVSTARMGRVEESVSGAVGVAVVVVVRVEAEGEAERASAEVEDEDEADLGEVSNALGPITVAEIRAPAVLWRVLCGAVCGERLVRSRWERGREDRGQRTVAARQDGELLSLRYQRSVARAMSRRPE